MAGAGAAFRSALPTICWPSCTLSPYAPDLNPVEGAWSVLKRGGLANLAVASLAHLLGTVRRGLAHKITLP